MLRYPHIPMRRKKSYKIDRDNSIPISNVRQRKVERPPSFLFLHDLLRKPNKFMVICTLCYL